MHEHPDPSPYPDVNRVVETFRTSLRLLLGEHFAGMYLVGSLALGDFDPARSDIDFIVVTDITLPERLVEGLEEIHERFASGSSPWASRIEAVYVPLKVLQGHAPLTATYPHVEKGTLLTRARAPLEQGWAFQKWTLRERGVVVAGPDPGLLSRPVEIGEIYAAVAAIAGEWLQAAQNDPSWLDWLRPREHHAFIIQTLCRMLYSLATGAVVSKPRAMEWARQLSDMPWSTMLGHSPSTKGRSGPITQREMDDTLAFIRHVLAASQHVAE